VFRTGDEIGAAPRAAMLERGRVAGWTEIAAVRIIPPDPEVHDNRVALSDASDLVYDRRYTYVVVTADLAGRTSLPSNRLVIDYVAPPEAPTDLGAVAGDHEVRLTWEPPERLVDGRTYSISILYEVLRATAPEAPLVALPAAAALAATTYVDRAVENDTPYYYAVRGVRQEGATVIRGPASERVSATPVRTTAPAPPTDLTAAAAGTIARLAWRASPEAATYVIYRATGAGPFVRIGSVRVPVTTFVDRDVPPGTYRYAVSAQDASARANESARSGEVTVTLP
jgi:fibronectin type 3 domain-containing protein